MGGLAGADCRESMDTMERIMRGGKRDKEGSREEGDARERGERGEREERENRAM